MNEKSVELKTVDRALSMVIDRHLMWDDCNGVLMLICTFPASSDCRDYMFGCIKCGETLVVPCL